MTVGQARQVADAVLYEGYVLYPYRASAMKNQVRWQFGVLTPPAWGSAAAEPSATRTEVLVETAAPADARLRVVVRFLRARAQPPPGGAAEAVETGAEVPTASAWDEGTVEEVETEVTLGALLTAERSVSFDLPGGRGGGGEQWWPVSGLLRLRAERPGGVRNVLRVRALLENASSWDEAGAPRPLALRRSLIGAHLLLEVTGAAFVSLLDPPDRAAAAADACVNEHTFPVLVGERGERQAMLSSPIILYDYPSVAPESPADTYDATEMDELLALRTMTLTDAEKAEARATDPRAAAVVDRADTMPPELLDRLHGAVRHLRRVTAHGDSAPPDRPGSAARESAEAEIVPEVAPEVAPEVVPGGALGVPWWDPGADASVAPETDSIPVAGTAVAKGSRVRLWPRAGGDAQDMFLRGRTATVQAVFADVDDGRHLAVTLDDDPAADLHETYGRYLYFGPDEVEPQEGGCDDSGDRRVLVAGVGNIFLGDDGFGVEVARRLASSPLPDGVRVLDAGIRGVHLAYELLDGYDLAILVDVAPRGEAPGTVFVIEPDLDDGQPSPDGAAAAALGVAGAPMDAHGMEPGAVLEHVRQHVKHLGGKVGRLLVVGCEPAEITDRIGLSEPVGGAVDRAAEAVRELVGDHLHQPPDHTDPSHSGKEG